MLSDEPIGFLGGAQHIKISKGDVGKVANPLEEFLAFAEKEYCNDYGMALKAVWQFYKGIALSGNERIEVSLTMLDERITALESMFKVQMKTEQPKDKVITSLGGNPLRTVRQ